MENWVVWRKASRRLCASFLCMCSYLAMFVVSTLHLVLVVFLCCEAAVISKFICMYIEYSFPIVWNVIQKSSWFHSSKCVGNCGTTPNKRNNRSDNYCTIWLINIRVSDMNYTVMSISYCLDNNIVAPCTWCQHLLNVFLPAIITNTFNI